MITATKNLSHAVLLSGGTADIKKNHALQLARQLLCQTSIPSKICACQSCCWLANATHPDVLILPDNINTEASIKIDDIRYITQHLTQTAHQGKHKIAILLKADTMPIGAVNALLKTLEEPPAKSTLILLSSYPHLLPATLLSRCQKIRFPQEKSSSPELISKLLETLKLLKNSNISPFDAAAQWQSEPLLKTLDGLYYCLLKSKHWTKPLFSWQDYLNKLRQQILNKQNPNTLLALEHLFYQWTRLI